MSFPNIPNVSPTINLNRTDVVNLLLASIAFEELGLAHVINAEAEKTQAVLGTLPGLNLHATSISELLSVNQSVNRTLRTVLKTQMLLQFKLEDVFDITTESTTTSTTTTTTTTTSTSTTTTSTSTTTTSSTTTTMTTTSETTTTATVTAACDPALTYAVFANRDFSVASASTINNDTQANGDMTVTGSNNTFLGNTNVVGTFSDTGANNMFQNLTVNAAPVPIKQFDATCLENTADIIINANVNIANAGDAAIFQGNRVWVNGSVSVTGANIGITGGGILARDGITISGGNFTYTSTSCFALYSQTGDIRINNGPYNITGLIYTASTTVGDIRIATSQGGRVCGALMASRDVIFTGGSAVHEITDISSCSPCLLCNDFCPPPI